MFVIGLLSTLLLMTSCDPNEVVYLPEPPENPIVISTTGKIKDENLIELTIQIELYKGFHIYREVGKSDPYIPMRMDFLLPDGCVLEGGMDMPAALPFGKTGTMVYEGKVTINQLVRYTQLPQSIKLVFSYQCCDSHVCLPPQKKEFEIKIK